MNTPGHITLTKSEANALRYVRGQKSVWSITATPALLRTLETLRAKGLIQVRPRRGHNGSDYVLKP